ncbi:uncharacterized protein LOC126458336 [Schistocerca serialis cubense]|uniref:uncharacterized protein LOC126458336 n=1 Tax=Schistocerca serialis cubense TaxID=2023355 RepID=UPI00214E69FC|nr:uncharacterized protein LOC126458336 [Schistocerca serialis cubense]
MMKSLVFALVLVAAGFVAPYPRYEEVVRSPKDFDLLYSSTSGPHNETWYFASVVNLTSIIIPSQIFNFWSSGPWTSGSYKEEVDIYVYETVLASGSGSQTYLLASGSFNGTARFGQELDIPLRNATLNGAPPVGQYFNAYRGYKYTVNIVFKKTGIYPWYTTRTLSTYSVVSSMTNGVGIAIGLSYTLV